MSSPCLAKMPGTRFLRADCCQRLQEVAVDRAARGTFNMLSRGLLIERVEAASGRSWPRSLTPETPLCIQPWSVGALVIKQSFRTYDIPRRGTGVVGQKIETGPAVTKRCSGHSQRLASHGKLARRKTARQQLERIHVGQAIRLDLHCRKSVPVKCRPKERPGFVNFRLVAAQEISDRRGDAGDMNMQLVLAATGRRINCHSDLVARQLAPCPFLDEAAGAPRSLPVVRRVVPQQRRTFDAGNASGWDDDDMRSARRRPEHGKAVIKTVGDVDLGARKRRAEPLVGWQTDVVDDDPQPAPVGRRDRMRQTPDRGEDQPHGGRETGHFVQEEPFQNALSHYLTEHVANRAMHRSSAAATAPRHVSIAVALKARCVLAEVSWRWTLKV